MQPMDGETSRIHPDLPVFRIENGPQVVLFAPGISIATTRAVATTIEARFSRREADDGPADSISEALLQNARSAHEGWRQLTEGPFEPECLTLYLSNRCNLACGYCYSQPLQPSRALLRVIPVGRALDDAAFPVLPEPAIAAAAELVASNAAARLKPLTLVLHGGGEPTLHWDRLVAAWGICGRAADNAGTTLWSYIATNGMVSREHARWLARHMNLIGLSCDGPPDLQDTNRKTGGGASSSAAIERTASVLVEEGCEITARATITRDAMHRQTEIVDYLCTLLHARTLRFEPAYDGRRAVGQGFQRDDAVEFVSHFLDAREVARSRECDLQLSGVRLDELHGPFCNPLRQVLQLLPDGSASACFLSTADDPAADKAFEMGALDRETGAFVIDHARVAAQRRNAARIPTRCHGCHNVYHCARDCPDSCVMDARTESDVQASGGGFRCEVQRLLGLHDIWTNALVAPN